jgi:hypothetical protein
MVQCVVIVGPLDDRLLNSRKKENPFLLSSVFYCCLLALFVMFPGFFFFLETDGRIGNRLQFFFCLRVPIVSVLF